MASQPVDMEHHETADAPTEAADASTDTHVADAADRPPSPDQTPSIATTASLNNLALEVDSNPSLASSDTDSAITNIHTLSSTQSARSSIFDFVEEEGRTFHKYKEGKYVLPNDGQEQDRLDLQHHLLLVLLENRLQLAPIGPNPQNVLDVGTGTGIWAIEFANRFPSARVIGSDLSPIQPEFVPSNLQFEIDDAEDEWIYSQKFDLIHGRGLMTCFSDPRSVLEKAFNQLAPGGYLEMQDGVFPMLCRDGTLEGTALDIWAKECVQAGIKIGREWTNALHYKRWMEEIGFEDVKEKIFEVATSPWPRGAKQKELGMWFQADMMDVLSSTLPLFTRFLGYSRERIELLLVEARKDLENKGVHAYMPM